MPSGCRDGTAESRGPSIAWTIRRVLGASLVVLAAAPGPNLRADDARLGEPLRIAVLAYEDRVREMHLIEQALGELRAAAEIRKLFQLARGTHADVLHWLDTGAVDMAVVTPAILGKAMEQGGAQRWE